MTCDTCKRPMNYCFYIYDEHWFKAVGKKEGHICAHCILEKLGGSHWTILWDKRSENRMKNEQSVDIDSMCVELMPGVTARVAKDAKPELLDALKAVAKQVLEDPIGVMGEIAKKNLEVATVDRETRDIIYSNIESESFIRDAVKKCRDKNSPMSRCLAVLRRNRRKARRG